MSAPTPGPWHVVKGGRMVGREIRAANGTDIAKVYDGRLSYGERNANAHRLAAAPELYESLREMRELEEMHRVGGSGFAMSTDGDNVRARCAAALAKAEGRS